MATALAFESRLFAFKRPKTTEYYIVKWLWKFAFWFRKAILAQHLREVSHLFFLHFKVIFSVIYLFSVVVCFFDLLLISGLWFSYSAFYSSIFFREILEQSRCFRFPLFSVCTFTYFFRSGLRIYCVIIG